MTVFYPEAPGAVAVSLAAIRSLRPLPLQEGVAA
jgi:hypothetical protein